MTSPRREMVTTNGNRQVNVHKDKDPPHLGPPHQVKVAFDLRRHRRKDTGRPVKVPRVCVHRLHLTQEIGGQVGDRLLAIAIDCHQLSRRVHQHRDAGCRTLVVTYVDSSAVIVSFMDRMLCRHRHPRVCDALCVVCGDATHPATRLEFRHRLLVLRGRHPTSRRDQHPSLPISSPTGSGARPRANESRRHLHALSQIRRSLCLCRDTD